MISGLTLRERDLKGKQVIVVRGSEILLRDQVLSLFDFDQIIDAVHVGSSEIAGRVESNTIGGKRGDVLIQSAEKLVVDKVFDEWLHRKIKKGIVVLLVSIGEKLLAHYSRVVGRRGVIVNCDLMMGDDQAVKKWISARAARKGVRLLPHIVVELMERCGDLMTVDNELEKLRCGWKGREITIDLLDVLVLDRGGGVPLVFSALVDGSVKCLKFVMRCLKQGLTADRLISLLVSELVMRLRLREQGANAKRAAQELGFDQRRAVVSYDQGGKLGTNHMWEMVSELVAIQKLNSIKQVALLRWLACQVGRGSL